MVGVSRSRDNADARRRRLRRRFAFGAVLIAILAPSIAIGASASGQKSYPDGSGENVLAPDIVRTAVTNTDGGDLRFAITLSNRPVFGRDMLVVVFLDTRKGGDPESDGADYIIQIESGLPLLFRWNGKDFLRPPNDGGLGYRYPASGPIIELSSSALGWPKSFKFRVLAGSGVTRNGQGEPVYTSFKADASPDTGRPPFSYEIATRLRLAAGKAALSPAKPRAGAPLAVVLDVASNDRGPVTAGTVKCVATIGGAPVAVRSAKVRAGVATCSFVLPAGAKGRRLAGTITVASRGLDVTRAFGATVG